MGRSTPTVADVFRRYGEIYRAAAGASLSTAQRRVMTAIERCDQCGHTRVWYNSCRDRHCPQCQSLRRAAWITERQAELLACEYFHVVFFIPEAIAVIALQNKAVVYGILFRAAAATLRTIAADAQHLGAEIGFFAVLHTWGQTLVHHPHLHCFVPGGGIAHDGTRWVACRPGFFLPVRVLSRLFRRLFVTHLEAAFDVGALRFFGPLISLQDRRAFLQHLAPARQAEWVVYAKRPFAGPQHVLDYVGRYTHRIAISDSRLVDIHDGQVTFRYKNYRETHPSPRTMTLSATEFIRRFLLHVLPAGFHRIRYYGFLGHRHRTQKLAHCRELLGTPAPEMPASPSPADYRDQYEALTGIGLRVCPVCHDGHMLVIQHVARAHAGSATIDSS